MPDSIQLAEPSRPQDPLTPHERGTLEVYLERKRERPDPPLAPSLQLQLFELFLNGKTCEEISKLNPGIGMGQVLKTRIEGDWDEKRHRHMDSLLMGVASRVQQVQLESVVFISDMLSATHKLHGEAIKRYLQTGNQAELKGLAITNMKAYKEVLETLLKMTGQTVEKKQVTGEIRHIHETGVPDVRKPATPQDAAAWLKALDKDTTRD
jgi:hypothetical protein